MSVAAVPLAHTPDAESAPSENIGKEAIRRQIPSLRNREVYVAVAAGKSHAQAGQEFGLTQPRVTQIVQQVREWAAQESRGEGDELSDVQRLRLAEWTLGKRLETYHQFVMDEWRKSCREGAGRPAFIAAAMRLALQVAKVEGVDITGKSIRLKAEEEARKEAEARAEQSKKALWETGRQSAIRAVPWSAEAAATADMAAACEEQPKLLSPPAAPTSVVINSYGPSAFAAVPEGLQPVSKSFATPLTSSPTDKPIPKFLDKKVRKRLLALRRQQSRAESLSAVG